MIGPHDEVSADHAPSIAFEPLVQTVGKKTDARQRGHGEHQREQQHRQLAGPPVTRRHPHRLAQQIGPAKTTPRCNARGSYGRR